MKVLAVGDIHLKSKSLEMHKDAIKGLLALVKTVEPDYVVMLGDQLDGFENIKLTCIHVLSTLLTTIVKETHSKVVVLVGNHEMSHNRVYCSTVHALSSLHGKDGITIVDRPTVVNPDASGEPAMICSPFIPKGRFCEAMDEHLDVRWKDWRNMKDECIVFAHQEIRGVQMNQIHSTDGDYYDSNWPTVVSGHIHESQTIGNVIYVGTPWHTSFTAHSSLKTVAILTFHGAADSPAAFNIRNVTVEGVPDMVSRTLTQSELSSFHPSPGSMYKLLVKGNSEQLSEARKTVAKRRLIPEWQSVVVWYSLTNVDCPSEFDSASQPRGMGIKKDFHGAAMRILLRMIEDHEDRVALKLALRQHTFQS